MLQVKVFDEEDEDDLSDSINDFLIDHEEIQTMDIKFSTAMLESEDEEIIYSYSALLIYSL